MNKLSALVLGIMLSTDAVCATGWTGFRTILELETGPTGVELRLEGFGDGCASLNEGGVQKTWAKIEANQANEKQHVSTLLMAFAAGKKVTKGRLTGKTDLRLNRSLAYSYDPVGNVQTWEIL